MTCGSWDDAKVISADQSIEVTGMGKTLVAARVQRALEFLNVELTGLAEAGRRRTRCVRMANRRRLRVRLMRSVLVVFMVTRHFVSGP